MAVYQREIVELQYELPNGQLKTHPALVISNTAVHEIEGIFYALMISSKPLPDEFAFELNDKMLTKPLSKTSYVKCQLIQSYSEEEILKKHGMVKQKFFNEILEHFIQSVLR